MSAQTNQQRISILGLGTPSLAKWMLGVSVIVAIDVAVIGSLGELSITEITQEGLLFISTILFALGAWRQPQSRGLFVLGAGLFGCMFIREHDALLDQITHGFWLYPAVALAATSILYASTCSGTIVTALRSFLCTKPFKHISIGLLIVLVYSRIAGTGLIWSEVIDDQIFRIYKTAIQEGLELLGDVLIAYGSYCAHSDQLNSVITSPIADQKVEGLNICPQRTGP